MKKSKITDDTLRHSSSHHKHHSESSSSDDSSSKHHKHHSSSNKHHSDSSSEEALTNINIDNNQINKATIKQSNTFVFIVGGGKGHKGHKAHTTITSLGDLYKIDIDENGEVTFNGEKMESQELGNGLKGFVIRQNKVTTNDD